MIEKSMKMEDILKNMPVKSVCPWCNDVAKIADRTPCYAYDCTFYDMLDKARHYRLREAR